jgi:predicted nucleotidyltransferase
MSAVTTPAELSHRLTAELRAQIPDLIAIYLFGSRARGDANAASDFDVAVLAKQRLDPIERWELQERLAALLGCDVDLVDLLRSSTVMRMQVVTDGRVLYEADRTARQSFEATSLSSYARLNEERRGILTDIAMTGRIHG